ncbi:unnamed protein product [Peniophora sp. CBMAI 1063]|nr:unnamed protein product [Peniophora sp. CBMAI 1063]
MAADPSYPLLPVANILCAGCLFLLLVMNVLRRSHAFNVVVNLLSFSLFWETLLNGIGMIVWANDANIKAHAFCDIVSHVNMFNLVAKPAYTLLLSRQLKNIVAVRTVRPISSVQRKEDLMFEIGIGVILPALCAGPLYYVVQPSRFSIIEGFGCADVIAMNGVTLMTIYLWLFLLPLFSVLFYFPRIVLFLYRHSRLYKQIYGPSRREQTHDIPWATQEHGRRLFILGCLDILLSLPVGLLIIIVDVAGAIQDGTFSFYPGWHEIHTNWQPRAIIYADLPLMGWPGLVDFYFSKSSSIVLGFCIFALFGWTKQTRATYVQLFWGVLGVFGKKKTMHDPSVTELPTIRFSKGKTKLRNKGEHGVQVEVLTAVTMDPTTTFEVRLSFEGTPGGSDADSKCKETTDAQKSVLDAVEGDG